MTALATVDSSKTSRHRDRAANDWYVEPAWAVDALINAEPFKGLIWDPACGAGNIPERFKAHGFDAVGSDLVYRNYGAPSSIDFLLEWRSIDERVANIVSNPPYALAEEFIRHALTLTTCKVAMLLRLAFLEGQKRKRLFESTPILRVLVFSERVSMPPGGLGVAAEGGAVAFAWFIWEHGHRGPPELGWLDSKAGK